MFESHFALRENPFVAGHQSRFVYPSPEHQEALAHLRYGIENHEPFVLITGEVGTGKTTALFEVLSEYKSRAAVAVVTNSALSRTELLEEIGLRLGFAVPPASSKPQLLSHLERHLLALRSKGEHAILLLDEAQNLEKELLEELRLLSNLEAQGEKLLQIFLLGQPELEERLSRPELRQLRQRIAVHYRLKPLTRDDTHRYIHHRIAVAGGYGPRVFPSDACDEVFALSHGIPREINQLCSQALLNGFVEDAPVVRPDHVRAAAREIEFESVLRERASARLGAPLAAPAGAPAPEPAETPEPERALAPEPPAMKLPQPPAEAPAGIAEEPASELPLNEAVEHVPATPVVPATDEASWEAWVRSLMGARPEPAGPATEPEIAPHAAAGPGPAPGPEAPGTRPIAAAPEPFAPPTPAPGPVARIEPATAPLPRREWRADLSTSLEPTPVPIAPPPAPTEVAEPVDSAPARAAAPTTPIPDEAWRPRRWTPEGAAPARGGGRHRAREWPEESEGREREPSSAALRWMVLLAGAAAVTIAALMWFRFGQPRREAVLGPARTAPASEASATEPGVGTRASTSGAPAAASAPADTARVPRTQDAKPAWAVAPAQAALRPAAGSMEKPPPPATTPAARDARRAPRAEARTTFALVVGTFLELPRAEAEGRRLTAESGYTFQIREVPDGGTVLHELALGSFPDRSKAEQAAGDLIAKGLVDEARVVPRHR